MTITYTDTGTLLTHEGASISLSNDELISTLHQIIKHLNWERHELANTLLVNLEFNNQYRFDTWREVLVCTVSSSEITLYPNNNPRDLAKEILKQIPNAGLISRELGVDKNFYQWVMLIKQTRIVIHANEFIDVQGTIVDINNPLTTPVKL